MSKDTSNFLRKVVKFVSHPATDWTELDSSATDNRESEYAKAEIKAMIERKRRNDFVRKRELDMLRKIRREGLSHDSALALTSPSNLDSESSRINSGGAKSDVTVKAKIDAIEQQMVGAGEPRRAVHNGDTSPPTLPGGMPADGYAATRPFSPTDIPTQPMQAPDAPTTVPESVLISARTEVPRMPGEPPIVRGPVHSPLAPTGFTNAFAVDVNEITHDSELDEAVIAFANADFEQCERNLMTLIQPGGPRHGQSDTWMVLFDLYRALDQQPKFDTLANAFVHQFGLSAPQWYSLPERVSRHLAARTQMVGPASATADVTAVQARAAVESTEPPLEGWIAPPILDTDALGRLRCEVLQLPRPWVMDWAGVEAITPEAAGLLHKQFNDWGLEPLQMTWIGIDRLLEVLTEMSPTGNRDVDPDIWMLRLELLRLSNRPDQFDEAAIDYCVTYELSPPSWEAPQCNVKLIRDAACTQTVSLSHIGDVSTSFVESILHDDIEFIQVASLELSGQLSGDIGITLSELDTQLGASVAVQLDCAHLIRVDFIAAGDLLNWVLARSAENRTVTFVNPHRLVALFFGAMGITEHAKVKLQLV
jgi:ABC-type transporter Mla MlaB component